MDPSLSISAALSMPGIEARSCAEETCSASPNQLAHNVGESWPPPFCSPP